MLQKFFNALTWVRRNSFSYFKDNKVDEYLAADFNQSLVSTINALRVIENSYPNLKNNEDSEIAKIEVVSEIIEGVFCPHCGGINKVTTISDSFICEWCKSVVKYS